MVGDSSSQKGLASSRWAVEQDALGLRDAQGLKNLRMFYRELDDLFDFLDLFVTTTYHVVVRVRLLLDLEEGDERVNFALEVFSDPNHLS